MIGLAFSIDVPLPWRTMVILVPTFPFVIHSIRSLKTSFYPTIPMAFGVRGILIATTALLCLYNELLEVSKRADTNYFHFLAMVSWAMAAWFSCGLASFTAWAAYPEYGTFRKAKRLSMASVQTYFAMGFVFELASYFGYRKNQVIVSE